jgi:putative solute:sodium symporter small subunit
MTGSEGRSAAGGGARNVKNATAYWRANLRLMAVLLAVWALVSFGFGVWLREPLDALAVGGAPLGFWFAQQGAIYVFVALIFVYAFLMKRLDARHEVDGADAPGAGE